MKLGNYCRGDKFPNGITNGASWYSVSGGMQDWNYLNTNDFEITLELGCIKYPEHAKLPDYWHDNKESLLKYLEAVHSGVKGVITDNAGNKVVNASILVEGVNHETQSTEDGEYWRLLPPGVFKIIVMADGLKTVSKSLEILDNDPTTATILNFEMEPDNSELWSNDKDYGIKANMARKYLSNDELKEAIASLENEYPTIAEALINEADWQMVIPGLKLALDPDGVLADPLPSVKILLVGGLFPSQSVGREMLLRLARHMCEAFKQGDNVVTMILKSAEIYILPSADLENFNSKEEGQCLYSDVAEMDAAAGNQFYKSSKNKVVQAIASLMGQVRFDYAVSFEGNGVFMRVPWDNKGPEDPELSPIDTTLNWLAKVYKKAHSNMRDDRDVCKGEVLDGKNVDEHQFPEGVIHGSQLQPPLYKHSFIDFAWREFKVPAISAHISCCNFPTGRDLPAYFSANMAPMLKILTRAHQGVWGIVLDPNNKPLPGAQVKVDNRIVETDHQGRYLFVLPVNSYFIQVYSKGHMPVSTQVSVDVDMMTRRDIILESSSTSKFAYHNLQQKVATMKSLAGQYEHITELDHSDGRHILKIGNNLENENRPPVLLFGYGALGAEVASNLAIYFVTHHSRDDTVTTILESVDLHIGFLDVDYPLLNTSETCSGDNGKEEGAVPLVTDLKMHGDDSTCLFNLGFMSGNSRLLTCPTHSRMLDSIADKFKAAIPMTSHCMTPEMNVEVEKKLSHAAMMVSLSCCSVPQNLGQIFDVTKKAVIDSLVSVQGVHLHIFDEAGVRVTDEVVINIANQNNSTTNKSPHNTTLKTTRGRAWQLLEVESFSLDVTAAGYKPVYKSIMINSGEINHIRVRLEREAGVPVFVVLAFLSTGFAVIILGLLACRMEGRRSRRNNKMSYKFQPLPKKKDGLFSDYEDDSDLEDVELEKQLDKIGVKTDYLDGEDDSSSDIEDVLLVNP
eukprot:TRINITY_DN2028_c0_g1_i1.p1 TRINITY_DN2028_c0_g1~~TRINITY_DN2028_c0_g1_i1.p1  ORF type:complete len:1121 (+),score=288.03 TRINITY_DN2028_c0_g1_i1:476-3364(+)